MSNKHYVKSWTHLFQMAKAGVKTHDFRDMTERDYKVGDIMVLQEFDYTKGEYTGDSIDVEITYITDRNTPCAFSSAVLKPGYGVLSIKKINKETDEN